MASKKPPNEGDTVYVVHETTFAIAKVIVRSNPSEILYVSKDSGPMYAVGPARWATTPAEARTKALAYANSRRQAVAERLDVIDAAIVKLKGKK